MGSNKEVSVGVKFTGDSSGFERAVGQVRSSVSKVTSSVTSFAAGFLSVGIAVEGVKKVFNSTEGSADILERTMGSLRGTTEGLFRTIATGDWGNFIENITSAAKATRELTEALDDLEDISASNKLKKSRLNATLEDLRVQAAATTDSKLRAQLMSEAIATQKSITDIEVSEQKKRISNTLDYYKTLIHQGDDYFAYFEKELPKLAGNWEYFGSATFKSGLEARKASLEYYKSIGTISDAQSEELHTIKLTLFALEDYKTIKDDLSKPGQFNAFVEDMATLNELIAKGSADLVRLQRQLTTAESKAEKIDKVAMRQPYKFTEADKVSTSQYVGGLGLRGTNNAFSEGIDTQIKSVEGLQFAFENLFMSATEGWESMVNTMISELQRLVAYTLAKAAVFGIIQILTGNATVALNKTFGQFINPVGAFASGTNFAPGGMSLVGERGPELVNLPRGSQVLPMRNQTMVIQLDSKIKGRDLALIMRRNGVRS